MLKFWLYAIIIVIVAVIGLGLGSANDSVVAFDFLFVKLEMSLAMVLVAGIVIGLLVGFLASFGFCIKMWRRAHKAQSESRRLKKEHEKSAAVTASGA